MDEILNEIDLEIRIQATESVRNQYLQRRMEEDRSTARNLDEERVLRALTDDLITLRAQQLDSLWSARTLRRA